MAVAAKRKTDWKEVVVVLRAILWSKTAVFFWISIALLVWFVLPMSAYIAFWMCQWQSGYYLALAMIAGAGCGCGLLLFRYIKLLARLQRIRRRHRFRMNPKRINKITARTLIGFAFLKVALGAYLGIYLFGEATSLRMSSDRKMSAIRIVLLRNMGFNVPDPPPQTRGKYLQSLRDHRKSHPSDHSSYH